MNARAEYLGKWELGVLILCGMVVLLTIGAAGESGRQRAKEVVCQANLRQWHDIFQGYIDPNGRFISGDRGTPGYWWIKYLREEHKDWKRTRIWFCPRATGPVVSEDGKPTPKLTIFSAWGIYGASTASDLGRHGISGSYGINGYVIPIAESTVHPTTPGSRTRTRTYESIVSAKVYESGVPATDGWQNLHEVPNANTVPMFVEALRFDLWPNHVDAPAPAETGPWTGVRMAQCCINRHDGAVNCLFVDGSVRKVGLKELWMLKWHRTFYTVGPWTKAGGVLPYDWPPWMRPFKEY